jgi:multisubunit Na+/H+ antiporter MnhG subunit
VAVAVIAQAVLLAVGVGAVLISCVGLLVFQRAADRLHLLSLAASLGSVAVAAAVVVREGLSNTSLKAGLIAVLTVTLGPVLSHATGRAARISELGDWRPQPGEEVRQGEGDGVAATGGRESEW